MTYEVTGGTPGDCSGLIWSDALGNPPASNSVVVGIESFLACGVDGEICVIWPQSSFVRGDSNDDGVVDIADAVALLGKLFPAGSPPPPLGCLDAGDGNDDGTVNIGDAVAILSALFLSPPFPLPAPFPFCGDDTTDDPLLCDLYLSCP